MSGALRAAARTGAQKGRAAAPQLTGNTSIHRAANAGAVISAVVIGVVALVGILIFAQVNGALPDLGENSSLAGSQDAVVGGFGGAMELVPVILIVLLASVVIAYVQRMRQ